MYKVTESVPSKLCTIIPRGAINAYAHRLVWVRCITPSVQLLKLKPRYMGDDNSPYALDAL